MKLYEIYEGIRAVSIMDIAERIVGLKTKLKFKETISDADWQWLRLTCENQSILSKLSKASNRYISPTTNYADIPFEFLRSGGTCAEAKLFLSDIKRDMDYEAETKILQATDEVMNSEEMAQIAQQQAYVDLQNSYTQATNDNAELVTKLANSATDI
jgi:hypothetical protein